MAEPTAVLHVVKGDATPEEVAALVAVIGALAVVPAPPPARRTPAWSDPLRALRPAVSQGPGGWRASTLPR